MTHSAPTHHFGDKAGLLTAFAVEGFRRLREHMLRGVAVSANCGPEQLGLEYVRFAVENPAHFAVMFRPEHLRADDHDYRHHAMQAFAVLVDAVRDIASDAPPDDAQILKAAVGAWSMAHGFATLWLEGDLAVLTPGATADDAALGAFEAFGALLQSSRRT